MATLRGLARGVAVALVLAALDGCGGDGATGPDHLVRIPFTQQQTWCAGVFPGILTVTDLYGPRGATVDNVLPGTYRAVGTYNLTGSGVSSGVVEVGFLGTMTTGQGGQQAASHPDTIPAGSVTGSFDAIQGFLELSAGSGRPLVDFVVGSSVYDCVSLH
jgi:hypothetical protein